MSDGYERVLHLAGRAVLAVVVTVGGLLFAGFLERVWSWVWTRI
jgi:hypothetical protein